MIDHRAYHAALRAHAEALVVCTTGEATLAATAQGFTRTSGSFLDDGFLPGMEVRPAGFAKNTAPLMVSAVTALLLSCPGVVAEAAAADRTLAVRLPCLRALENEAVRPVVGRTHVAEQFIPGPSAQVAFGTPETGVLMVRPQYALHVHVPAGTGSAAAYAYASAICRHFRHGLALPVSNGDVLRVRSDAGPFVGRLLNSLPAHAVVPVTIPCEVQTLLTPVS